MEPFSTIALLGALTWPVTVIQNLNSNKIKTIDIVETSIINKNNYIDVAAMNSTMNELKTSNNDETYVDVIVTSNDVICQLHKYSTLQAGWDGSGSLVPSINDIQQVIEFIDSIPAIYPLPKAMLSSDGSIGLYWDDNIRYIDIQFDPENTISIFFRDRSSGKEEFIDAVDLTTIQTDWFYDILGELLIPTKEVLAA